MRSDRVGSDLCLGDRAITDEPDDLFRSAPNAAEERHLAVNRLGQDGVYSPTVTPT